MSIAERGALSVNEVAEYLSLGRTKIFEMIRSGELDSIKVGRRRLIKAAAVRELLGENER